MNPVNCLDTVCIPGEQIIIVLVLITARKKG